MNPEQVVALQAAMAEFLQMFRPYFQRRKTFGYLEKYVLGLMTNLDRKSIEPIALAAGVPVRTLQEFLAFFHWDHVRMEAELQRRVADEYESPAALGILDATGHVKQGKYTPGVTRHYCGETGKNDNCVVAQHLLYSNNHPDNPFQCVLATDLYLPENWAQDRERCRQAGIPDELGYRPKWQIGLDQLRQSLANGVKFSCILFDADYGRVPKFMFGLDSLGLRGVGIVPPVYRAWASLPRWVSGRAEHASRRVDNLVRYSQVFTRQEWHTIKIKDLTRGESRWRYKAARVHLVAERLPDRHKPSVPTDRQYWLIVAENCHSKEVKYLVSNAPAGADIAELLRLGLERWQVEQWFERAKQECGLGAFEVRTYTSLMRHWLCCRLAMYFLSSQTCRLRKKKSADHPGTGGPGESDFSLGHLATPATDLTPGIEKVPVLPMA